MRFIYLCTNVLSVNRLKKTCSIYFLKFKIQLHINISINYIFTYFGYRSDINIKVKIFINF
jgi:hypothetical protein